MAVDGVILLKFYGVGFETLNINENESVIDPQITEIQVLINLLASTPVYSSAESCCLLCKWKTF